MPQASRIKIGSNLQKGSASIDDIVSFISEYMSDTVIELNENFSPRQLIKRNRDIEQLPTDPRQLSSYRTRIGTILEYAISACMDRAIERDWGEGLRLTFAVAHKYPDFYFRDTVLRQRIRIEMKAVDRDSDEQSARFEVLSGLIKGEKDVVVLIGWEWHSDTLDNGTECEYPMIFSYVVVPSNELAKERDKGVKLRGGRIESNRIMVRGSNNKLTPDKGNVGKIRRIVHKDRRSEPFSLSEHIQRFLQFIDELDDVREDS